MTRLDSTRLDAISFQYIPGFNDDVWESIPAIVLIQRNGPGDDVISDQ